MNSKKYTKYVIIIFAVIFLISAALLLLELWEKHRSEFPELSEKNDVIEYNGQKDSVTAACRGVFFYCAFHFGNASFFLYQILVRQFKCQYKKHNASKRQHDTKD